MESGEPFGEIGRGVFGRAPKLIAKSEIRSLPCPALSFCNHPNPDLLAQLPSLEFSIRSRTHANRLCTPRAEPLSRTLVNPREEPSSRTLENPRKNHCHEPPLRTTPSPIIPNVQPPFRDVTVGSLVRLLAHALPDHEALVYSHAGLRYTFRQLEDESRRIARGLMASGVTTGDRVAVWATNVPEWVVLQFALAKIGAILVTVNTSLRAHEIEYLLRQSEASTLITIRGFRTVNYLDELRTIGALDRAERGRALPHLKRLVLIGENCPDDLIPYDRLRTLASHTPESQLDEAERAVALDAVINMQYTSGTTGFPKGVMLSSRNIVNNGYWLGAGLAYTPADRLCLCVPLFHCFGCVIGVLGAYAHGACLCVVEAFDARKVLETVERERCTALYGVPTMFLAELEDPEFAKFDLTSLADRRHGGRAVS